MSVLDPARQPSAATSSALGPARRTRGSRSCCRTGKKRRLGQFTDSDAVFPRLRCACQVIRSSQPLIRVVAHHLHHEPA